jgi:hypothetical protein
VESWPTKQKSLACHGAGCAQQTTVDGTGLGLTASLRASDQSRDRLQARSCRAEQPRGGKEESRPDDTTRQMQRRRAD